MEWESLEAAASNQSKHLRLVDGLADFRDRIRARAETLDAAERLTVLRTFNFATEPS